jgi:hypothetical protein
LPVFFLVAGLALLWLGQKNRPDPLWRETARLIREQPVLLYEQPDSLQRLFCSIHGVPYRPGDSSAWRFVAYPHLSTIEWAAFSDLAHTAVNQRFIVVAGVTGAGATKYSKHLGRLLAGRPERLLEVDCAPLFDLEYHKKYIGYEEGKRFYPGVLVDFWDRCRREPRARFVVVVDNFDKINPETFFGPALWEALGSRRDSVRLGNRTLTIPENFHLISVVHRGPGALTQFNQEHYKRLGRQYVLEPNLRELRRWLGDQKQAFLVQKTRSAEDDQYLAALQDTAQLHRYLYFFAKTNWGKAPTRASIIGRRTPNTSNLRLSIMSTPCSRRIRCAARILNRLNTASKTGVWRMARIFLPGKFSFCKRPAIWLKSACWLRRLCSPPWPVGGSSGGGSGSSGVTPSAHRRSSTSLNSRNSPRMRPPSNWMQLKKKWTAW